jgi:type IV pilus assembly protein PilA
MRRLAGSGGFTLVELMISVAIVGLLAATAVPSFMVYQLRAKRSEAYSNLGAIAKTQITYHTVNGIYWDAAAMPGPAPTRTTRPWTPAAMAEYAGLGWTPEGNVFFDYEANTDVVGGCCVSECFTLSAYGELDGDGAVSVVMYVHPDSAGNSCPAAITGDPVPLDSNGNPIFNAPVVSPASDDF